MPAACRRALITETARGAAREFRAWAACLRLCDRQPALCVVAHGAFIVFGVKRASSESAGNILTARNAYIETPSLPAQANAAKTMWAMAASRRPANSLRIPQKLRKLPVRVVPLVPRGARGAEHCRANYRDYALRLGRVCGFSVQGARRPQSGAFKAAISSAKRLPRRRYRH